MFKQCIPHITCMGLQKNYNNLTYSNNSTYIITKILPVFLGGKPGTERIVLYSSRSGSESKAEIQRYSVEKNLWATEYAKQFKGVSRVEAVSGYWEILRKYVVIFYYRLGDFLDYYVIGKSDNGFSILVERIQVFMGDIWFEGGKLVEAEGNRYKVWRSSNQRLTLVPYRLCIIPGSKVIEYKITKDEKVLIDKTKFQVNTKDIIQVIRTDNNPVLERILYYFIPGIKYIPHKSAFKINANKFKFIIVPAGYNWNNAVIVTVEVENL